MTNFPAIRPSTTPVTLGSYPAFEGETQSGRLVVVRHGGAEVGIQWTPQFTGLTYNEWADIKDHWAEHGTVSSFLFETTTLPATETPEGYRWWWAATPSCSDDYDDFFTVTCSFRCDLAVTTQVPTGPAVYLLRAQGGTYAPVATVPPPAPTLSVAGITSGVTTDGFVEVGSQVAAATWQYSTDSGGTWSGGSGAGFQLPQGDYSAGQIRVRQVNAAGPGTAAQNASALTVAPPGSVVIAFTAAAGVTATGTVTLPAMGELVWIRLGWPAWFSLYCSAAARTADAARSSDQAFEAGRGICCDPRLLSGDARLAGLHLLPFEGFKNEEGSQTYYWKCRNEDTVARDFAIILQYVTR